MNTMERIETILLENNETPGLTASFIAKAVGAKRKTVMNRISDLRVLYGVQVFSNTRKFQGKNKVYYRIAA